MFKKHVTSNSSRQLGGKDWKQFKSDIDKKYPSLTDEQRELLVPKSMSITKLSNRSLVYSGGEDGNPLFFDPNGHGDKLLPTVCPLTLRVPATQFIASLSAAAATACSLNKRHPPFRRYTPSRWPHS